MSIFNEEVAYYETEASARPNSPILGLIVPPTNSVSNLYHELFIGNCPQIQNESEIFMKSRKFWFWKLNFRSKLENFDASDLTIYFERAKLVSLTLDSFKSISQYQI